MILKMDLFVEITCMLKYNVLGWITKYKDNGSGDINLFMIVGKGSMTKTEGRREKTCYS